jgi:predicted phage gp36 major capsid-like protein
VKSPWEAEEEKERLRKVEEEKEREKATKEKEKGEEGEAVEGKATGAPSFLFDVNRKAPR